MLLFASLLFSILLRGLSRFLMRTTGAGHGLSLALVSLALLAVTAGGVSLIEGSLASQISELRQQLPRAVDSVIYFLGQ